jgi:hypothetical protein
MELRPHGLTAVLNLWYSEFDRGSGLSAYPLLPVLYPQREHTTQARKLFRREPAITEFDKLFTPTHKSSRDVAQSMGSDLPPDLSDVHPAHG